MVMGKTTVAYLFVLIAMSLLLVFCVISSKKAVFFSSVFFSSNQDLTKLIVERIKDSSSTIKIAMYNLKSVEIINALLDARMRGVEIIIVADGKKIKKKLVDRLTSNGIHVKKIKDRKMHNKFAIFDNNYLLSGSFNWKSDSELTYDNILLLKEKRIVKKYFEEFTFLLNSN